MKPLILDDFSDAASWQAIGSGEAELKLTSERTDRGYSLRMDFDFKGGGGFVVARKEFSKRIPEAYAYSFHVRGVAPKNKLEFKLVDLSGKNVWRWQEEAFVFDREGRELFLKSSQIEFAWGPAGGGSLRRLGAIEFVIRAGPGGKGTVWLENFCFLNRTPRSIPNITSSSSMKGCSPFSLLEKKPGKEWRNEIGDAKPWLKIDFHQVREYGGLIIDWAPIPSVRSFTIQASDDGRKWRKLHQSRRSEGPRSFVSLPNGESRFLRLLFDGLVAIRHIAVQPFEFSRSAVEFFHVIAAQSGVGRYPRWLLRQQSYWTCAGVPDGETCALINEEGQVEPDKGTFSLEPFLYSKGKLMSWADAKRSVCMEKSGLAIPSAIWKVPGLRLETTTFATGHGSDAVLFVRYRLQNTGEKAFRTKLFIAIRPFQVNPPWQSWQGLGGVSQIHEIAQRGEAVCVNHEKWVIPLTKSAGFGAAAFEQGVITDFLAAGKLPAQTRVKDDFGFASAAMRFDLNVPVGSKRDLYIAVPFGDQRKLGSKQLRELADRDGAAEFDDAVQEMNQKLASVSFDVPDGLPREAAETFRTAAGQILMNRDGSAIQPGPRRYTRSWIRDGVIMGAALLRIGDRSALAEFIRWYAPHQRQDGFVPCCVDRTGPDWLVEHDSHGQLIFGVMECFRFTGEHSFLKEMWPYVRKAARFLKALRAQRLTAEYQTGGRTDRYGLLPESASHEGYLAHPVHSYWDDFWALRGFKDAAAIAKELGHLKDAAEFVGEAESFRRTLRASIRAVIDLRRLDYVPGSVEWADFDPTATSNAITLLNGLADLPLKETNGMFDRFVADFRRKRRGEMPWVQYTAYEIRIVGALIRLGKRSEALELLSFYLSDRRPRFWNQWPEISWKNRRSPGHLGDVPHTWIAAESMLVFAQLFAYEKEEEDSLIIGAGVDVRWLTGAGVSVHGLPTWYGEFDLSMRLELNGNLRVTVGGKMRIPGGGIVVSNPGDYPIRSLSVNGAMVSTFDQRQAVIDRLPADLVISFGKD